MIAASFVLSLIMTGQCPGGVCPAPTQSTVPSKVIVPAQSGSYYAQGDGRIVDWARQSDGSITWKYRQTPMPKKPEPPKSPSGTEPASKPSVPTQTINYGIDLSGINPAEIGHLDTNDPTLGQSIGLTSKGDPDPSILNPKIEPKLEVNISPWAVISVGAIVALVLISARRKS